MKRISIFLFALLFGAQFNNALAEPWASPGDTRLRNDLQLLDDAGAINIPLSAWPIAWGDLSNALEEVDVNENKPPVVSEGPVAAITFTVVHEVVILIALPLAWVQVSVRAEPLPVYPAEKQPVLEFCTSMPGPVTPAAT